MNDLEAVLVINVFSVPKEGFPKKLLLEALK